MFLYKTEFQSIFSFFLAESTEEILLANMEVFIIIVAIVAVVAALLLLLLLQLRIKKHASDGSVTQTSSEPSFSEIAAADPNDPYYKNGPPPYREGKLCHTLPKKKKYALCMDVINSGVSRRVSRGF